MDQEKVFDLIDDGRALLARMRELNRRSGRQYFPLLSRDALSAHLMQSCQGARSIAELQNPRALALPPIDPKVEAEILRNNPDNLTIRGEQLVIEYEMVPKTYLTARQVNQMFWKQLPDSGVALPNGRLIQVVVEFNDGVCISESDIVVLKRKCNAKLLKPLWDRWHPNAPLLSAPNLNEVAKAEIPPIKAVEFARSPVDNTPLMAYGTIALNEYSWQGVFKSSWHLERADAEAAREKAVEKLATLKSEESNKALIEALKRELGAATSRMTALRQQQSTSWFDAPSTLRARYEEVTNSTFKSLFTYSNDLFLLQMTKKKVDTVLAELEERFKPAPVAQASIAALAARFGGKAKGKGQR